MLQRLPLSFSGQLLKTRPCSEDTSNFETTGWFIRGTCIILNSLVIAEVDKFNRRGNGLADKEPLAQQNAISTFRALAAAAEAT